MHPYPTGQASYVDSFNDAQLTTEGTPATIATETVGATLGATRNGAFQSSSSSSFPTDQYLGSSALSSQQHPGGLLMAFMAGLVVAVLGMHVLQGRRSRQSREAAGYSSVPDSAMSS
jgi:hypothetical protein